MAKFKNIELVDFHAHILPGADHGSDSLKTSLWQLNEAKSSKVSRIIATPHFYPHRHTVDSFIQRRNNAYDLLKEHIPSGIEIRLGAEALICPGFENLPDIDRLFIEGTKALLIELLPNDYQDCYYDSVREMTKAGINVILAHANRYPANVVDSMVEAGAGLQLNASSLLGLFKRKDLYTRLEQCQIVALGSDIHSRDARAYRDFNRAIKRIGNLSNYVKESSDKIWKESIKHK